MKSGHAKQTAFTIVELLIVIVVIAILAAISIVAYNGIQDRANTSAVKSDAATIQKKMEMKKIDLGSYPASNSEMPELKVTRSAYATDNHNLYFCYSNVNDEYAVSLRSKADVSIVVKSSTIKEVAGLYAGNDTCGEVGSDWISRDAGWTGYRADSNTWNQSWKWTSD